MRRTTALAICVLAFGLPLTACGGGGSSDDRPAANPELRAQAAQKVEEAAAKVVNATPDKYLADNRKYYKPVCIEPDNKLAVDVPANAIKCHIEAFYEASAKKPQGYIGSEDWVVTVNKDKSFGQPEISGEYRIKAFLEADNKYNCSGGKNPPVKCTPPPPPPPEAPVNP
jgi:hypothetical protein